MLVVLFAVSYIWNHIEPQNKTECAFKFTIEDYWEKIKLHSSSPFDMGHLENCDFGKYSVTVSF
jgi:hypothetical protein